jgi:stress response protein YsnF
MEVNLQKKNQPTYDSSEQSQVIPVMQEELQVTKRMKSKGVTRVKKTVEEREEIVDEPLLSEEVQIERIPINRFVEKALPVRHERDTTIIPVFQEVLTKRLLLKEELHIRKVATKTHKAQKVILRDEQAVIEHIDEDERKKQEDK